MLALALGAILLAQQGTCPPDGVTLLDAAAVRVAEFDLQAAAGQLRHAVTQGCRGAEVAAIYLRGLVDAAEAFRHGGSPESLVPVGQAVAALAAIAQGRPGPAEIARLMLQAAAAASQSERDEMRLYLDSAVSMETLRRAGGLPGAPLVSAAAVAGDLWLQVHRYEEARESYATAAQQTGPSLRVLAGLARAAVRLSDPLAACAAARTLVEQWGPRQAAPPEIREVRAYLDGPACAARRP